MRALWRWHEDARLVALAQRPLGRLLLWASAAGLLVPFRGGALAALVLAAVLWLPARRRALLGWAGLAVAGDQVRLALGLAPGDLVEGAPLVVGLVLFLLALSQGVFLLARHLAGFPGPARRHPHAVLHSLVVGLLVALWFAGERLPRVEAVVPALALLLPFLVWRWGYLVLAGQRGKTIGGSLAEHLYYLWPAWGGTQVPQGKGADHLARSAAADGAELARTQLGGLKLLGLAWLWHGALRLQRTYVHGKDGLGLPRLDDALAQGATCVEAWAGVYLELVRATLAIAVLGHVAVGCLRLFGFDVFRNTYAPLLSESVVDFWNRFYHYFKELLVEFFFYPTYLSCFRRSPRLRLWTATFAAAFAGNMYYHVLRESHMLVEGDWRRLAEWCAPRLVYCLLLTVGIYVSMRRQEQLRTTVRPGGWRRLVRIGGVWTFYALIHVWSQPAPGVTFGDRARFFLNLLPGGGA